MGLHRLSECVRCLQSPLRDPAAPPPRVRARERPHPGGHRTPCASTNPATWNPSGFGPGEECNAAGGAERPVSSHRASSRPWCLLRLRHQHHASLHDVCVCVVLPASHQALLTHCGALAWVGIKTALSFQQRQKQNRQHNPVSSASESCPPRGRACKRVTWVLELEHEVGQAFAMTKTMDPSWLRSEEIVYTWCTRPPTLPSSCHAGNCPACARLF